MKKLIQGWQIYFRCRSSDSSRRELFTLLWNQYQRQLIFFIQNMVRINAEDLFQEVMLKVYRNLEKYSPAYSFNTWIYSIARNHCINYLKKNRVIPVNCDGEAEEAYGAADIVTPEKRSFDREVKLRIKDLLTGFDDENRQIAFLYFYEEMKNHEIARIMEIPTGTVKSRIHKIRAVLKKGLEEYYER